jgi:hypothetical protein
VQGYICSDSKEMCSFAARSGGLLSANPTTNEGEQISTSDRAVNRLPWL